MKSLNTNIILIGGGNMKGENRMNNNIICLTDLTCASDSVYAPIYYHYYCV